VGVPIPVIHYLIRRGAAATVDIVARTGTDLRRACFLFGEKLVYLRRKGIETRAIPTDRWVELFRTASERPVLWQAWEKIVRAAAAHPEMSMEDLLAGTGLGTEPAGWRETTLSFLEEARASAYTDDPERVFRFAMIKAMSALRGKVAAETVAFALKAAMGGGR
jgi:Glu-tRNA(Gln) amidotransferase subunit E-like FAD-binding protein